jgi:hypothetical protein
MQGEGEQQPRPECVKEKDLVNNNNWVLAEGLDADSVQKVRLKDFQKFSENFV